MLKNPKHYLHGTNGAMTQNNILNTINFTEKRQGQVIPGVEDEDRSGWNTLGLRSGIYQMSSCGHM